jgi:uncharacterized membrane protein YidH (DUF202 family)
MFVSGASPVVVWTMRIGVLTVALNALSLIAFWAWTDSLVVIPLLCLLPFSAVVGVLGGVTYARERAAVSRSSAPPKGRVATLYLSLSIVVCALVVLSIVLYHGANLGNLDPGGL